MATLLPTLNDHDYENWVKGGLSLKFARQGIVNFAKRNIDQFHNDILTSLQGLQCNSCSTENNIRCKRNNNYCKFDKNNCIVHDQKDPNKTSKPCPNLVCNFIRDEIVNQHRFSSPSWRNTDTRLWCQEPWQLATCYMSAGYSATTSASETDFPGLLCVIINNKVFETEVTDNLENKDNVFCKARDARNAILHKADMRLSDTELGGHITTLDTMLSDTKCLAGHPDAIQARAFLQQIKNGTIKISTKDEGEVRAEALKAIEEKKNEALESLDARGTIIQKNLNLERKRAVTAIEKKEKEATVIIQSNIDNAAKTVNKEKEEATVTIKSELNKAVTKVTEQKDDASDTIKSELDDAVKTVHKDRDDARFTIKSELDDAVKNINKEKDDATVTIKTELDNAVKKVNKETDDVTVTIKTELDNAVKNVNKEKEEATVTIKSELNKAVTKVTEQKDDASDTIKSELDDAVKTVHKDRDDARVTIKSELDDAVKNVNKEKDDATVTIKTELDNAVKKVNKETDDVTVTIKTELDNAVKNVNKEKEEATVTIKSELNKAVTKVTEQKDDASETVKSELDNAVKKVNKEKDDATVTIKSELVEGMTEAIKAKLKAIEAIETQEVSSVAAVQKAADEAKRNPESASKESLNQKQKDLKKELLFVYQDGDHMSTSLGPLATDEDITIDELYVAPNMELVDDETPIKSYQDIYKAARKKIYIVGEAGTGKTSLCQNMVSNWCQAHTETIENISDNQQAMAKFDFLFYISLRYAIADNTIDEMIRHQLLPNKPHLYEPLSRVLEEKNCLIILDGLDEWTTENKTATSSQVNSQLPGRDAVRKCTVLTTTRPWKLESLKLKSKQIDAKVKLLGIDGSSSEELIQKIITRLNDKFHCQKTYENYVLEIEGKDLDELTTIPVILKQIVCLWHSGRPLGKTKSAIYIQTLELLFKLAQTRLNEDHQYQQKREEWTKSSIKLPPCFDDNATCQDFKPLIAALSGLAFPTLFSDDQKSSLVFESTKAGCHNLSPEEVSICLKIGILSQDKILIDCTSQYKKISFLHKTYQEFLAAVFVSQQPLETNQCIETILKFCNCGINSNYFGTRMIDLSQNRGSGPKWDGWGTKWYEMSNTVSFIAGICTSDITCALINGYITYFSKQPIIVNCMKAGWTCSHNNRCLYMKRLDVREPSEYLDQLCRVNIHNTTKVDVYDPPTARFLEYLLQIHKLNDLTISTRSMSEDILYDLIHHHRQTLTGISIGKMTLRSNTKLSSLIENVPNLLGLFLICITLPQQLLDSLNAKHHDKLFVYDHTILPATECTA